MATDFVGSGASGSGDADRVCGCDSSKESRFGQEYLLTKKIASGPAGNDVYSPRKPLLTGELDSDDVFGSKYREWNLSTEKHICGAANNYAHRFLLLKKEQRLVFIGSAAQVKLAKKKLLSMVMPGYRDMVNVVSVSKVTRKVRNAKERYEAVLRMFDAGYNHVFFDDEYEGADLTYEEEERLGELDAALSGVVGHYAFPESLAHWEMLNDTGYLRMMNIVIVKCAEGMTLDWILDEVDPEMYWLPMEHFYITEMHISRVCYIASQLGLSLPDQHDYSKYEVDEVWGYICQFVQPLETIDGDSAFQLAKMHHYVENNHHPEYFAEFDMHPGLMGDDAVVEMIIDRLARNSTGRRVTKLSDLLVVSDATYQMYFTVNCFEEPKHNQLLNQRVLLFYRQIGKHTHVCVPDLQRN